jgi:hypothetical protein
MPTVVISLLIVQKIDELFDALLEKDYFSDPENAASYCDNLFNFIEQVPQAKHFRTKDSHWGTYYAAYKANRRTTWYCLFDNESEVYIVRYLLNNHTSDYPYFISHIKK